jgi:NADH-quinone oxidoreductase subunit N
MAAGVKAAAFAAFFRVFLTAFPGLYDTWGSIAFWLAVATMVGANLIALAEGNVKRMLAYSSVAHAGYLLVAVTAATPLGASSFLFYLVVYTLMTIGAFAVVLTVARQGEQMVDLDAYSGLGWRHPLLGVAMTIFLLSLAGFPFTGGFIGKFYILRAAVDQGLVKLAIVLVLASLLSYYYYLRVAWYMWFREAPSADAHADVVVAPGVRVALVAAMVGILLLGIFPGEILELAERSTSIFAQAPADLMRLSGR